MFYLWFVNFIQFMQSGTMFGIPRIIQNMASEQILPFSACLSRMHGESRVPIAALLLFSSISFVFIVCGDFNQIALIVTVTVLFTYALMEYAYFCLAFTLCLQRRQDSESALTRSYSTQESLASSMPDPAVAEYGACDKVNQTDLDKLFPERNHKAHGNCTVGDDVSAADQSDSSLQNNSRVECQQKMTKQLRRKSLDATTDAKNEAKSSLCHWLINILSQPHLMLLSAIGKLTLMFCVHWMCSVIVLITAAASWLYLGRTCAVANRGCSEFNLMQYIRNWAPFTNRKSRSTYDEIVVASNPKPCVAVKSTVVSHEGSDFSEREKYHLASTSSQIGH